MSVRKTYLRQRTPNKHPVVCFLLWPWYAVHNFSSGSLCIVHALHHNMFHLSSSSLLGLLFVFVCVCVHVWPCPRPWSPHVSLVRWISEQNWPELLPALLCLLRRQWLQPLMHYWAALWQQSVHLNALKKIRRPEQPIFFFLKEPNIRTMGSGTLWSSWSEESARVFVNRCILNEWLFK